jgi:hypothetical protein
MHLAQNTSRVYEARDRSVAALDCFAGARDHGFVRDIHRLIVDKNAGGRVRLRGCRQIKNNNAFPAFT